MTPLLVLWVLLLVCFYNSYTNLPSLHIYFLLITKIGSNYYVRILSTIDRELLKPSSSVALHRHSNSLVDVLPPEADSSIQLLSNEEKPDVSYADIGNAFLSFSVAPYSNW